MNDKYFYSRKRFITQKGNITTIVMILVLVAAAFLVWLFYANMNRSPFEKLKAAAEKGDAEAQYTISGFYLVGKCVPRDYGQSEYWLKKAVSQGHEGARKQFDAAKRIKALKREQIDMVRIMAEKDDSRSQFILGLAYLLDDNPRGFHWLKKSAKNGEELAKKMVSFIGDPVVCELP